MIAQDTLVVFRRRIKRTAINLILKYGDRAEEIAYGALSGDDLKALLEAIKDHRAYKEEGWRIVKG